MQSLIEARVDFRITECCPTLQNACLALLLGSSRGLHALSVQMQKVLTVPPLCNLRHLVLTSEEGLTAMAAAELSRLASLETLFLGQRDELRPFISPDIVVDLASLANLHAVALDGVVPQHVRLPVSGQCLLHIAGWGADVYRFAVREAGSISSLRVLVHEHHGAVDLRSIFGACCNLTRLLLRTDQKLGSPGQPISLRAEMANLLYLSIDAPSIYLQISSDANRLAEIALRCERLWLGVEDVGTVCAALQSCKAQFTSTAGAGMSQLIMGLKDNGFACECTTIGPGLGTTTLWCSAFLPPCDAEPTCGACKGCLVRIGAATFSEWPECESFCDGGLFYNPALLE
jgi:hypothetical protein